jgi:hypothetical protein
MKVFEVMHVFYARSWRVKMPARKLRHTKIEDQEYRACLTGLEKMGVPIGCGGDSPPEADRLTLEQNDYELGALYELPSGAVVAVVPVTMTVRTSGILILCAEMTTPWDDFPLNLSEPESSPYCKDVIGAMYHSPPNLLNRWLTHHVPLRPRQEDGVFLAYGSGSVPPDCCDETVVTLKLLLIDQRDNELRFDFEASVDRRVKRKCERRQRETCDGLRLHKRVSIFEREETEKRDQARTTQEQGTGPISSSPVVVSERPTKVPFPDVPRDNSDELISEL